MVKNKQVQEGLQILLKRLSTQNGIASEVRTFVDNVTGGGTFQTVTNKLGLDNLVDGLASSQSFTSAVAGL